MALSDYQTVSEMIENIAYDLVSAVHVDGLISVF